MLPWPMADDPHQPSRATGKPCVHPAREQLMAFLDGECTPEESREVDAHLQACPACRSILERFRVLQTNFSGEVMLAHLPRRDTPGTAPASPAHPALAPGHRAATLIRRRTPAAWAASVAFVVTGVLLWQLLTPAPLSAREFIERARISEVRPLAGVSHPMVQRTLRTTRRVAGIVRERIEHEELWEGAPGALTRVRDSAPVAREISASLPVSACAGLSPLSVEMMACLSAQRRTEALVITPPDNQSGAVYQLAIHHLQPDSGYPFTSLWTLRISDWRLIRVDYRFFSLPEEVDFVVEELASRVMEAPLLAAVPPPTQSAPAREAASHPQELAAHPSEVTLPAQALHKAGLLLALHTLRLRPEDDVSLQTASDGVVEVRALLPGPERKQAFHDALGNLAGVRLHARTHTEAAEEALAAMPILNAPAQPGFAPPDNAPFRGEGPLLLEALSSRFGGNDAAKAKALAFGNTVLEAMQNLRFQAGWLERTRAVITDTEWHLLPAELQQRLSAMDQEIAGELAANHAALATLVAPVLCPPACGEPGATPSLGDAPAEFSLPGATPGIPQPPAEGPSELLEREFAWLKVLFVDRAYLGQDAFDDGSGTVAGAIEQAAANWRAASRSAAVSLPRSLFSNLPALESGRR